MNKHAYEYEGQFGFKELGQMRKAIGGGVQYFFHFPNGHTASIIRTPYSIMSELGWYEGAVMLTECNNTFEAFVASSAALPNEAAVARYLKKVSELPTPQNCYPELYEELE